MKTTCKIMCILYTVYMMIFVLVSVLAFFWAASLFGEIEQDWAECRFWIFTWIKMVPFAIPFMVWGKLRERMISILEETIEYIIKREED